MKNFIKTFDHKHFFPYLEDTESKKYYVSTEIMKYKEEQDLLKNSDQRLRQYFQQCTFEWQLEQFHFHYSNKCVIEPTAGWAITEEHKIIPQSVWNYYVHKINKPFYLRYKFFPKKKIKLDAAISLQYGWMNYWHFYNDVLGQLTLADKAGLPYSLPVVVPAGLQNKTYFKAFLALSKSLQQRNWVFQEKDTHIICKEAHFFNTFYGYREHMDNVLNYVGFKDRLQQNKIVQNRVFINRSKGRGRNIENIEAVEAVLKKYAFSIIDCDALSLLEQIDLFQNAGFIIGIHGAGLTNIIYRQDKPLKLLEIFSEDYLNPSYYFLSQQYNFNYYGIVGSPSNNANGNISNFKVDIGEFEQKIIHMLDH